MIIDLSAMEERIAQRVAQLLEQSIGDDVLTTEQAAELLKLPPKMVRHYAKDGTLPAQKYGNQWRFRRSALLNHVTSGTPKTIMCALRPASTPAISKSTHRIGADIRTIHTANIDQRPTPQIVPRPVMPDPIRLDHDNGTGKVKAKSHEDAPRLIPPTPDQLVRRARLRAWIERNCHLLNKPETEPTPATSTETADSESQTTKQDAQ